MTAFWKGVYFSMQTGGWKSSEHSSQLHKTKGVCASSRYETRRPNRKKGSSSSVRDNKAGRPNSLDPGKMERLLEVYYTKPYSYRRLADMFGVSRMTVWRAVQGLEVAQR